MCIIVSYRQLMLLERTGQHERFQLIHTVSTGNARKAADRNTHIQPSIAIDDVIARFTGNAIAAATAEQDIAAVIGVEQYRISISRWRNAKNSLQATDPIGAGLGQVIG